MRFLEPINAVEEQRRFLAEPDYDPQFVYQAMSQAEYDQITADLGRIEPPAGKLGALFTSVREYLTQRLGLRWRIGRDDFWRTALYGEPSPGLLTLARKILSTRFAVEPSEPPVYAPEHLRDLCLTTLEEYGLSHWQVRILKNISSVNVEAVNRIINLRGDQSYSATMMRRLIAHEVETHVFRAENGYAQPYQIMAVGAIPGYLATEEGLAVVNEERLGYVDHDRMKLFAGRVLAAHRAQTSSFREVYLELLDYGFAPGEAFTVTKRVKRGLGDTRAPGGYIKDHIYLEGLKLVENYLAQGGDVRLLYVGKVGLTDLALLDPSWMRPPRFVPRFYEETLPPDGTDTLKVTDLDLGAATASVEDPGNMRDTVRVSRSALETADELEGRRRRS